MKPGAPGAFRLVQGLPTRLGDLEGRPWRGLRLTGGLSFEKKRYHELEAKLQSVMNRSRACCAFIMNRKTGTNSLTYASVETLKTNPIGRILPIAVLSDYLLGPALE